MTHGILLSGLVINHDLVKNLASLPTAGFAGVVAGGRGGTCQKVTEM